MAITNGSVEIKMRTFTKGQQARIDREAAVTELTSQSKDHPRAQRHQFTDNKGTWEYFSFDVCVPGIEEEIVHVADLKNKVLITAEKYPDPADHPILWQAHKARLWKKRMMELKFERGPRKPVRP